MGKGLSGENILYMDRSCEGNCLDLITEVTKYTKVFSNFIVNQALLAPPVVPFVKKKYSPKKSSGLHIYS